MKLTSFILILTLMQVSAATFGQNFTLKGKNITIGKVFFEIRKQTGYDLVLVTNKLKNSQRIDVEFNNTPVKDAVEQILKGTELGYTFNEKTIFIKEKEKSVIDKVISYFDNIDVAGKVVDENGFPLRGANIRVKVGSLSTFSDNDGRFTLDKVDENAILVISYLGYQSQEIRVSSNLLVTLILTTNKLEEVTINKGYYSENKMLSTGSVGKLSALEIEKQPVNTVLQALQGRIPGVYIRQNTGMAGGGFSVQIRGRNSLRTGTNGQIDGNLPLYLVDGIPFTSNSLTSGSQSSGNLLGGNPLASISPNDIESIEVLKDADATAIYGSRGANGVVLITTKKAKQGKGVLKVDFSTGITKVNHFLKLLNTSQYLAMRKEAVTNDGYDSFLSDPAFNSFWPDMTVWDANRETDWQKELIGGTGRTSNGQLSYSGGNEQIQYLMSGNYYRETTVFPGDNSFQRVSGKMTLNHKSLDKKLNITGNVNFSTSFNTLPNIDLTSQAVQLAPNSPALYDQNGNLNWESGTWQNPISSLERKYENTITNLITNVSSNYEIIKGFQAKINAGYTSMRADELTLSPLSASYMPELYNVTGSSMFSDSKISTWLVEPQLDFTKKIANGTLSLLVGSTFQESIQQGNTQNATGYTSDALLKNLSAAVDINVTDASYAQYRYTALFSRINYNLKDRYILNLTARRDGSSRFGSGKKFANFGSIGAAWVFSNESFLNDNLSFLSFGKLRMSYGISGSDAIGNYQYLNTYSTTTYPYNGTTGLVQTRLANPDFSWETNKKFESALEIGLFKNHLNLSAAFYLNKSGNQLVGLPLPVMTGQSLIQFNLPASVENKGWEFQINSVNVKRKDFEWSTNINATLPENKLVSFPNLNNFPAYKARYDIGMSMFIYKSVQYTGVNPNTGIYEFVDQNGDKQITSDDLISLAKITQTAFGGIGNSFTYKDFNLDIMVQFVKQTGLNYQQSFGLPGDMLNQPTIVLDRWQRSGDQTDIQMFSAFDPQGQLFQSYSRINASNHAVVDASFVRLKNISLSWDLPKKWVGKGIQSARFYAQGQNLFTLTNYLGLDPENQSSSRLPALGVMTIGVQIKL